MCGGGGGGLSSYYVEEKKEFYIALEERECVGGNTIKEKVKMVNVMKGILVECDPAMKQFLLYLDETNALGKKFVIQDLDDTHIFISSDIIDTLQEQIDDLMDRLSFPLGEK